MYDLTVLALAEQQQVAREANDSTRYLLAEVELARQSEQPGGPQPAPWWKPWRRARWQAA